MSVNLSVKQFGAARPRRTRPRPPFGRPASTPGPCGSRSPRACSRERRLGHRPAGGASRAQGFRIYLDDFGTGYSSLSYLHRFPVHTLKIDRSFVLGMRPDGGGREIVRTIVALAQNLDLHVIAEGVETAVQRDALHELRCEFAQGFMYSKPVDSKKAEALLAGKALP